MAGERFSRGDLLLLAAIFAVAGAVVAAYLAYEWYNAFASSVCDISNYFNCKTVGESSYAAIGGVPTAAIGLLGFLILFALSLAGFRGVERLGPWSADAWILILSSLGALIGLGLTFLEVFVISAVCVLCVTGFALDLGVLGVGVALRRMEVPAVHPNIRGSTGR